MNDALLHNLSDAERCGVVHLLETLRSRLGSVLDYGPYGNCLLCEWINHAKTSEHATVEEAITAHQGMCVAVYEILTAAMFAANKEYATYVEAVVMVNPLFDGEALLRAAR